MVTVCESSAVAKLRTPMTYSPSAFLRPSSAPAAAAAPPLATTMATAQIDSLDAFVLESLLAEVSSSTSFYESPASPAHAALSAFLHEMDALESDTVDSKRSRDSDSDATSRSSSAKATLLPYCEAKETMCPSDTSPSADLTACVQQNRAVAIALEPPQSGKRKRRVRPKEELDILRDEAESLQRDLKALQSSSVSKDQAALKKAKASPESAVTAVAVAPKQTGMVENRMLRKTVEAQLKFTRSFGDELLKNQEKVPPALPNDTETKPAPLNDSDLIVYYEALMGKLDTLYTQMDQVFADAALPEAKTEFQDAQVVLDQNKRATLQFRDVRLLPFDFDSVCEASWRCVNDEAVKGLEQGAGEILPKEKDLLLLKKAISVESGSDHELIIPARIVFKRFVTKERMVLCWEGSTDWPSEVLAPDRTRDVPMTEKGWAVIKPIPGPNNTRMSLLQACVLMKPGDSEEQQLLDLPDQVRKLTELVIPTYQQIMNSHYQLIENMLLDEYLK